MTALPEPQMMNSTMQPAEIAPTRIKVPRAQARVHPESLLRIPLVRLALSDPAAKLRPRHWDPRWIYNGVLPELIAGGFNPYRSEIFYANRSQLGQWLRSPNRSVRPLNEGDRLVREVCYAVHDYLHIWSFRTIRDLVPKLHFGTGKITANNFESQVFCHLLTEAAAVVGLDYWLLSTVDLNELCDIGTTFQGFAVSYRESSLREYRRTFPRLTVQEPGFFSVLARFFCRGDFFGVKDADELRRSPLLAKWLTHEFACGQRQREYTWSWLRYLAKDPIPGRDGDPVGCGEPWQLRLMEELGRRLWDLVKQGRSSAWAREAPERTWESPRDKPLDFRYINLHGLKPAERFQINPSELSRISLTFLLHQVVCTRDFGSFPATLHRSLQQAVGTGDAGAVLSLFSTSLLDGPAGTEPRDMFFRL